MPVTGEALTAMKVICAGEFLQDLELEIETLAAQRKNEKISLRNKGAAMARHAEEKRVIADFFAYCDDDEACKKLSLTPERNIARPCATGRPRAVD